MNPIAWVAVGVAAALLADLAVLRYLRARRSGARTGALAAPRPIPRLLPPLLIIAGAVTLFLGQFLEAPLPATQAVTWLSVLGLLAFVAGGGLFRLSRRHRVPDDLPGPQLEMTTDQRTIKPPPSERPPVRQHPTQRLELGALLLAAALLLYLGSSMAAFLPEDQVVWSYLLTGAGLGVFLLAAVGFSARGLPAPVARVMVGAAAWMRVSPAQIVLLAMAPILALSAWLAAGESVLMRQPTLAVLSWLGGIALVIVGGLVERPRRRRPLVFSAEVVGLGVLFAVAFLLRAVATAQIPWLFTGDEASAGLSAVQFIEGFRNNLFGVAWFSFPSLFFFVQSLFIRLFGQTAEALRILSALAGALAIPATFALAKQMFGRRVAWASAVYLTVFHFHIHFSRIGLNNIWDAFFMAAFSAAFWWAWKSEQRLAYTLAGIVLGLSQYFYVSVRVVLPLFLFWLLVAGVKDWRQLRAQLPGLTVLALALVATALPLAIFFARHPLEFQAPLGRVTALGPWLETEARNSGRLEWQVLLSQFRFAALGFTSVDLRLAYEPRQPMLLALPATLFLMGLSLIALRIRQLRSVWLVLWVLAAVFVSALSLSPPASQRYILVAPAVAILVALPLVTAAEWIAELWPEWRRTVGGAALIVLAITAWGDLRFYFVDYTLQTPFGDINTEVAQRLAELLAEKDSDTLVYFLGGRMGYRSHSNVPYLAPHVEGQDLPDPLSPPLDLEIRERTLFILLPERIDELEILQSAYPGGQVHQQQGRLETLFIAYELGS